VSKKVEVKKMVKIINEARDKEILTYLKDHTYKQTQEHFSISAQQVARVKKRNIANVPEAQPEPTPQPSAPQPELELPAV
jgi:DNA-directed RNA polymerase specialized sigma subunit